MNIILCLRQRLRKASNLYMYDASRSQNGLDTCHLSYMSNPMNYYMNEGECKDDPFSNAKSEIRLNAKEDLVFLDKCVTEIELPHLSESNNNDTSFYTVKDICIDEGVQSFQKISVEHGKVNNDNSAIWKSTEAYGNGAPMAELTQNGIPQDSKPSSVNEGQVTLAKLLEGNIEVKESLSPRFETCSNDAKERNFKCDLRSFLINEYAVPYGNAIGEGNKLDTTEMSTRMLPEKSIEKPSDALREFYNGSPQCNSSKHSQKSDDERHMRQKFDQVVNGDENLTTLAELCLEKAKGDAKIEEAVSSKGDSYKDNVSSFSATSRNIKPNFVDGSLEDVRLHDEVSTSDLDKRVVVNENKVRSLPIIVGSEETINEGTISARYSFVHLTPGDLGLPGLVCTSGRTISSDHAPYSGSISLRSDSSATSGHSFAFPILQSEWNSSPIRMAKADPRHPRRKHRWIETVICCKF